MASRGDIQAGKAHIKLYMQDSLLQKGMKALSGTIASIGKVVMGAVTGAAVGATAIAGGLAAAVASFADRGSEIQDASDRLGLGAEAVSELGYAAKQSGSDLSELEGGLTKMNKLVGEAANGNKTANKTLEDLGVSMATLNGKTPDKQLEVFADRIAAIQDPGRKTAAVMDIFGKSGTKMLPMLTEGAAGIRALRKEAGELGQSVSSSDAEAAAALGDAWDKIKDGIMGAVFQIGATLAPTMQKLADLVIEGAKAVNAFIQKWRGLAEAILSGDLETAGRVAFLGLKIAILEVVGAIGNIYRAVFGEWGDMMANLLGKQWSQILDGDMKGAFESFVKGITHLWNKFVEGMVNGIIAASKAAMKIWQGTVESLANWMLEKDAQSGPLFDLFGSKEARRVDVKKEIERARELERLLPTAGPRFDPLQTARDSIKESVGQTADAISTAMEPISETFDMMAVAAEEASERSGAALQEHVAGGAEQAKDALAEAKAELESLRLAANAKIAGNVAGSDKPLGGAPDAASLAKAASTVTFSASQLQQSAMGGTIQAQILREAQKQTMLAERQQQKWDAWLDVHRRNALAIEKLVLGIALQ